MKRVFSMILILMFAIGAFAQDKSTGKAQGDKQGDKKQQAMLKFLEAQRLAQDGDPKALDLLKEVIALDPSDAQPHVELGKIYFQNRNFQEAEKEAKEALRLEKDNIDSHRLLGNIYLTDAAVGNDKAKSELAIKEFEEVTKVNNRDDDAWGKLAELYLQNDKRDKAIDALKTFNNNNPDNPLGFIQIAQLYFEDRKYDDAAISARKAYDLIEPERRGRVALLLAESLRLSGKTAEAAELMSKNVGANKASSTQSKLIYAETLLAAGKNDKAVKTLSDILKLDPKNIRAV